MTVEGLVSLIKFLRQREPNDIVVAHHCNPLVLLSVLPKHGLHPISPATQICGRFVDPCLQHHCQHRL
jgi:hypothetical protein